MTKEQAIEKAKEQYSEIWDCDINHPQYEDTVEEIVTGVIRLIMQSTSDDCVSRQAVLEELMVAIKDMEMPSCCAMCGFCIEDKYADMMCVLLSSEWEKTDYNENHRDENCPLVEIEERKVGKWIVNKDTICCPFCNTRQKIGTAEVELLDTIFTGFKFCKYCGAEMRGSENG